VPDYSGDLGNRERRFELSEGELTTEAPMKMFFLALGTFVCLSLCLFATPIHAQTADVTTKSAVPPRYDITKEVTLTGTVNSMVEEPTPEVKMVGGSHLIIETNFGKVDASLGAFSMKGEGTLSVSPGQRVQLTGVMKTIRDHQVLVARIVRANGRVYTIRNEHGFLLTRSRREGIAKSGTKGGQL
jgi:DNA/RNA endonuclease YhcR with UshA esterase domain